MSAPTAAVGGFPYKGHRSMAQVMADEAAAEKREQFAEARAKGHAMHRASGDATRQRILDMLEQGMSFKDMTGPLGLSQQAVGYHWSIIRREMGEAAR